jgi:hypothetical protein
MKTLLMLVGALLVAANLSAQTVVNPAWVDFDVSTDHSQVDLAGNPKVTGYTYRATVFPGSTGTAVTVGLGMPVPMAGTKVSLPIPGLSSMTQNVLYEARVTADGPTGSGVSAPSNPFGVAVSTAPAAPTNVRVR